MNKKVIMFAAALAVSTPALAQDAGTTGSVSVGVTGGTLGIGPEVGFRFSDMFGVRGNVTFLSISQDAESDGVDYDGKLKLASGGLMLDVHPFGGGFRVSGGARINGNKVRLTATPTEDVEIGDEVYTPEEIGVLSGNVKAKSFAPTLTLGYFGGATRGLNFGIEAGGMFQGSPRVRDLKTTGLLATDPDFQEELAREADELEDEVDYKIFPIVQVSLGYRF
ncbi:hypothetical protein H9L13_03780 [Sphingomonas lutea]|uniref:Outer membrane beta-barrel protein n=1 Tax=Sphingomonas lutea TaxID=1045317 RepID=A0A7G9SJK9_9SPHN|nr:hypothetical protein [Sphingomonas lutea]QNN68034.1 hypothetical protein H9L13_03780 [Sphingomonas lutea]